MARLIDADALKETIGECPENWTDSPEEVEAFNMWHRVMDDINSAPTIGGWISVKDRLPVETHSIFYKFYGTQKWSNAMWREQSDKVLVTVAFKDGTRTVTTGETHDGIWNTTISRTLEPVVTHWQAMPESPKEG